MRIRTGRTAAVACALLAAAAAAAGAREQEEGAAPPSAPPSAPTAAAAAAEARAGLERSLSWLLETQNADGSWGHPFPDHPGDEGFAWDTYYAWQMAAHGLACMALVEAPATVERSAALGRALEWLTTAPLPMRGSDWDVDSTWASLYGFAACVRAAGDARVSDSELAAAVRERGLEYYADLERRQTPDGGWAYYDAPPFTARPTWATSFCTALVIPALLSARDELAWPVDSERIAHAVEAVRRAARPNGAFAYDVSIVPHSWTGTSIDGVKGSLGRIQVCLWALRKAGVGWATDDRLREGLASFFEHHRFLDLVRLRPIPHEGHYANAGYFYFFAHLYAARVIGSLPEAEREAWFAPLRHHVLKTLADDGSASDFLTAHYMITASTSYAILVLSASLPAEGGDG
ncbi:MAG: hypothetical protein CMJ84_03455 [Planctomycetes bacterium]|nr:hypothetical protein [Planctomycetota bacterium]MDP6409104.1 hypothetical protein [Planctomycetota bacterium]